MPFGDDLRNCQPEPRPLVSSMLIDSVKWLEYPVQFLGRDSRAIVRDGDKRFVPCYGAPYAYLDARWCVCAHICEQIQ